MASLPTPEAVQAYLEGMGRSPDEVYGWLKERGLVGNHHPRNCPIAMALRDGFPELNSSQDWGFVGEFFRIGQSTVVTPEAVAQFTRKFDSGLYYKDLYVPFPDS